jgi:hypothetical protein
MIVFSNELEFLKIADKRFRKTVELKVIVLCQT